MFFHFRLIVDQGKGRRRRRRRPEDRLQLRRRNGERRRRRRIAFVCVEPKHPLKRFSRRVQFRGIGNRVFFFVERIRFENAGGLLELSRVETLDRVSGFREFVSFAAGRSTEHALVWDGGRDRAVVACVRRSWSQWRSDERFF